MKLLSLLLFMIVHLSFVSQVKNLVLEGGGIRGIAYVGAIKAMEENGTLQHVENVAGTSVGGLTAALICVGYTSTELQNELTSLKFQKFNDGNGLFIGGTNRLINRYGWYKGEKLTEWINEKLYEKTGIENLTFQQLHQLAQQNSALKDLYVTATNLSQQNWQILSVVTFPEMRIADAIRVSASIPVYYTAVLMDKEGNIYHKKPKNIKTDVMSDGGFISNYPIDLFDSRFKKEETLGLRLDSEEQINQKDQSFIAPYEINNMKDYVGAFYNIVLENLNRSQLTTEDWERTVSISTCNIGPKVKRLKISEVDSLTTSGYEAMTTYLNK